MYTNSKFQFENEVNDTHSFVCTLKASFNLTRGPPSKNSHIEHDLVFVFKAIRINDTHRQGYYCQTKTYPSALVFESKHITRFKVVVSFCRKGGRKEKKDGRMEGQKEERTEGRKEGRLARKEERKVSKEGRREGRKEGRKEGQQGRKEGSQGRKED